MEIAVVYIFLSDFRSSQLPDFPLHFYFPFNDCFTPPILIFAANLKTGMVVRSPKSFMVLVFGLCMLLFSNISLAQNDEHGKEPKKQGFNAAEVIFDHILDDHEFHFFDIPYTNGEKHPVSLPLPIIIYSPQRGLTAFMSSRFEHGHKNYKGYKLDHSKIYAVNEAGEVDESVKVYDLSLTRNVVQMMLALTILVFIMIRIGKKYNKGEGVRTAPKGSQGLIEPVITFVRDEVAKPNLGHKADKYLPFLLTVFFFIFINNIFGLDSWLGKCYREYRIYDCAGRYFIYRDPCKFEETLLGSYFQSARSSARN